MAILSLKQLSTPLTREQARDKIIQLLKELKFEATSWQPGSIHRTLIEIQALVWSELTALLSFVAFLGFPDTSVGDALKLIARSFYQEEAKEALTTQGLITFTDAADGGPHTFPIGAVVAKSATGKSFRNIEAISIPQDGSVSVLFEADTAGSGSNVSNDSISSLLTPIAGVTVTNSPDPQTLTWITRSGIDPETDAEIRRRISTKFSTFSINVVHDGFVSLSLNAATGIAKVLVQDDNPRGPGTIDIYLAGKLATSGSEDVAAAQASFNDRVFDGEATCQAIAATEQDLDPSGIVYFDSNLGEEKTTSNVNSALDALLESLPIGGRKISDIQPNVLPLSDIIRAIENAEGVVSVDLTTPSVNVIVGVHSVLILGINSLTYQVV